tara:strand:+ start:41 stop:388 length:348 start_codon:yes stop_codon:yes gene_type:complete
MAKTKDDYKLGIIFRDKLIGHIIEDLEKLSESFDKKTDDINGEVYDTIGKLDKEVRETIANLSIKNFCEVYLENFSKRVPEYVNEHCIFTCIASEEEKDRLFDKYKHIMGDANAE